MRLTRTHYEVKRMDVQGIKYAVKLTEWRKRVVDCRTSGIPVKDWCKQHRVSVKTFYKWEKLVVAAAAENVEEYTAVISQTQIASESTECQLIRIEPDQLPAPEGGKIPREKIIVRLGDASAELPAGTSINAVAELLKAVSHP